VTSRKKTILPLTLAEVRQALDCIPPDTDRDTWWRMAAAIKSEFGDEGFDTWNDWSLRGGSYSPSDAKDTWRSTGAGGGIKIATLVDLAKRHGYVRSEDERSKLDPDALAAESKRTEERARQREAEEAEYRRRADVAEADAKRLWDEASESGHSPYLVRKLVKAYGLRFLKDGTALVPMRNGAAALKNLQRIAPQKPSDGGTDKKYLPGGRKTGLWHWCGSAEGAKVLLVAEGYATAATLHEASGHPVAVAFDAGNLGHVAKALRECYPDAFILVCGDDDAATEAQKGKNPGKDAAMAAAKAVKGRAVLPSGLKHGGTDFNDLAAQCGIEAVREQVLQAVAAGPGGYEANGRAKLKVAVSDAPGKAADPRTAMGAAFTLDERGVWYTPRDSNGNERRAEWICAPLSVAATTDNEDRTNAGFLLEFKDRHGHAKTWPMPARLLAGDGSEWVGVLRSLGLRMSTEPNVKGRLATYIDTRNPEAHAVCVDRIGWYGEGCYVLPDKTIGDKRGDVRYVFQSEGGLENTHKQRGTVAQWRDSVAAMCVGNSRFMFFVSCAFAGPMLLPSRIEGGGFHARSTSSKGKTSILKVASSVWGPPSYMQRWRATENSLEFVAMQHSDGFLSLDEIGQLELGKAGEVSYLLAHGTEKLRSTKSIVNRRRRTWRVLFISSGEVSLADHNAAGGKKTHAGQEVRMVDLPLDAGAMGAVEDVHGAIGPAQFADALVRAAAEHYGAVGLAWLGWASANYKSLPDRLRELMTACLDQWVPELASGQVRRVGALFALVAASGELATEAGLTGWSKGSATVAARTCFNAWIEGRGGIGDGEDRMMIRQVRGFLQEGLEGRFSHWSRAVDDHKSNVAKLAGFKRPIGREGNSIETDSDYVREFGQRISAGDGTRTEFEFFILSEIFRTDVCKGFDHKAVAKLLRDRGHLKCEKDRLESKQRLPGMGLTRCFHIKASIFADEL
jgi:putative DNA primase/helicase